MNTSLWFYPIFATSNSKDLCGLIDFSNITIADTTMNILTSGRERFSDDGLNRRSDLFHNEDAVYADYSRNNWVEAHDDDVFDRADFGLPSTYLSKDACESLNDTYTFHQ